MRNFHEMSEAKWQENKLIWVGLDVNLPDLPTELIRNNTEEIAIFRFNREIVVATADIVHAYKPNFAFYAALGAAGFSALARTINFINNFAPEIPVILDLKCGDIGNSNEKWVKAAFGQFGADAITVNPYPGKEAMRPFLDQKDKGIIVLCKTSNPGAGEFQNLQTLTFDPKSKPKNMPAEKWLEKICNDAIPLYQRVALNVSKEWNLVTDNCCLVVGATYPMEAEVIRKTAGAMPFLVPGVGKQEADVEKIVLASLDGRKKGIVIGASRSIIFASGGSDFADAARKKTLELTNQVNLIRSRDQAVNPI